MGTAIAYSTAYQAGPGALERLNGVLVVGEHHVDGAGVTKTDYHEWKA